FRFRHDLIDQTDAQRLLRVDMITGKRVAQRVFESCQGDPNKISVGRMPYLRLAENGIIRGDGNVAGEGEGCAGTQAPAAHRGDDRFRIEPAIELPLQNVFAIGVSESIV